jgi:uncharacterized protein YjbJ (UPF0337 family)
MNKDRVEGKIKDVAGRVQRQAGEWTGDSEAQVKGALKQAEGKVQNAFGKAKDAIKKPAEGTHPEDVEDTDAAVGAEDDSERLRRRAK